jgi:hypothetical protein
MGDTPPLDRTRLIGWPGANFQVLLQINSHTGRIFPSQLCGSTSPVNPLTLATQTIWNVGNELKNPLLLKERIFCFSQFYCFPLVSNPARLQAAFTKA